MSARAALFAIVAALLFAPPAHAEWVTGRGEHLFGPELAQTDACAEAERKAKEQALKAVSGERLSSEDLMVCTEAGDEAECRLNRMTWSLIDGAITGIRDKAVAVEDALGSYRKCIVTLQADVRTASGRPDPGFDMAVKLNKTVFRDGEALSIAIEPTEPMYLHVFQWLPYATDMPAVSRVFPNTFDVDNKASGPITVPTKEGLSRYDMVLGLPPGLPPNKRLVDEYLLIIGTRDDIAFREAYSLEEFNARILEIPRDESRMVKRGYAVVRR